MKFFTGQYDRTIDAKNRIQLPSQLRTVLEESHGGSRLVVTLGEHRGTLSIFTERGFEELAARVETEFESGPEWRRFELQFYALAKRVEADKQGRFVLPDLLLKKARLDTEVYLVGRKDRIELWDRAEFDRALGIDWDGDDWPDWPRYVRRRPNAPKES